MLRMAMGVYVAIVAAGQTCGQLEADERRTMLEQRREILAARLAEIDAELSGETPAGSVWLLGEPDAVRDDRPTRQGREPRHESGRIFDAETRERLLNELGVSDPELAKRIRETMRERRSGGSPVFGRLHELNELRERDPAAFEIRRNEIRAGLEVLKLSDQLREAIATDAATSDVEDTMERLRAAVARGFDAKSAVLRNEIERTEQRIDGMNSKLAHADANRSQIIEQHFDKLVERIQRAAERQNSSGD